MSGTPPLPPQKKLLSPLPLSVCNCFVGAYRSLGIVVEMKLTRCLSSVRIEAFVTCRWRHCILFLEVMETFVRQRKVWNRSVTSKLACLIVKSGSLFVSINYLVNWPPLLESILGATLLFIALPEWLRKRSDGQRFEKAKEPSCLFSLAPRWVASAIRQVPAMLLFDCAWNLYGHFCIFFLSLGLRLAQWEHVV